MHIAMLGFRAVGQVSGGIEKVVEELSARLVARGHEVTVFCRARYAENRAPEHRGIRLVYLPAIYTKHLEAISHTFLAVWRTLLRYDIVHVHATGPALFAFLPRMTGRKVVVTVQGLDWRREKWGRFATAVLKLGAWAAARFPHVTVVVSQDLKRHYAKQYHRDTVHVANGVSVPARRPVDSIGRFGVSGNDYVLSLGRLVPEKGCHFLIEAFRGLETDKKLLLVGEAGHTGDYVARLRDMAAGDDRIVFTGALYGEDKDEAYSNAACFVLPSTLEGMPLVLLEAMSYGCPVLCSNIPENIEVVSPGSDNSGEIPRGPTKYGCCFTNGSVEDLRTQLKQLLGDPDAARTRANAARDYVREELSWDRMTEHTEAVYRSLIAPRSGGIGT